MAITFDLLLLAVFSTIIVSTYQAIPKHRNINLLPVDTCGVIQSSNRLIGGTISELFEFPWMALLGYSDNKKETKFNCGGTLINDRYVLTAAHCVSNTGKLTLSTVRLGEYDLTKDVDCEVFADDKICAGAVQDLVIEEIIPHPAYNTSTHANDIALLRLMTNANISESVKPICLPILSSLQDYKLEKGIVTSWGRTANRAQSTILMKEELPIIAPESCEKLYKKFGMIDITDKQICAGGNKRNGPCGGDGGSPLQSTAQYENNIRYVQFGIVSFGPSPCSTKGVPDVMTNVSKYTDWILDNIKA